MKNLLDDPDVMALYESLRSGKYTDVEDYLTSFPETITHSEHGAIPAHLVPERKLREPDRKIFWEGEEVSFDFGESDDYGL